MKRSTLLLFIQSPCPVYYFFQAEDGIRDRRRGRRRFPGLFRFQLATVSLRCALFIHSFLSLASLASWPMLHYEAEQS